MEQLTIFSDDDVYDIVQEVKGYGRKTIERSLKAGEMLASKRKEKKHGEWEPFCEWLEIDPSWAFRLIKAWENKDQYLNGMTVEQLASSNLALRKISTEDDTEKQPKMKRKDWFDENIEDEDKRFLFREWIKLCKKTEKEIGIIHLNRYKDLFEAGVNHTNYKEKWQQ